MQAIAAALPEFDGVGEEAIAAPEIGSGHVREAGKTGLEFGEAGFECGAVGDRGALVRDPGAELAAARAGSEVGGGFFARHAGDAAFDADLAFELSPVEGQGGEGIAFEFLGLAAGVVGVKNEPKLADFLEQHDAGGGAAGVTGG